MEIRWTRTITVFLVALLLLTGVAEAAPDDPWVTYVANSVVNRAGQPAPVILRANPASGALVEVSRNGAQGDLFRHPYDLAVGPGGRSLYVADMGEFASGPAPSADGRIIRVDPGTGAQTLISQGGELVDPAGVAVAPDGSLLVVENVGVGGNPRSGEGGGQPAVIRIDPRTGGQTVITRRGRLCYPFGIAVDAQGRILVSDFGELSENGSVVVDCPVAVPRAGSVIRIAPSNGQQELLSFNPPIGGLFLGSVGLAVEPTGTVLVVNQRSADAAVAAVDPFNGLQSVIATNASPTDQFETPQRVAIAPDGNLVVSDYALNNQEGGLVSVVRATGEARLLRKDAKFNNPLGLAIVVNRPPGAVLKVAPRSVGADKPVSFDASGSSDPEGLPLRYEWDLDGNGVFETDTGTEARTSRSFASSTTLTPRVRVTDPHGARAVALADSVLKVDTIRPVLTLLRASSRRLAAPGRAGLARGSARKRPARAVRVRFRVSESARVSLSLRRAVPGRRVRGRCVSPRRAGGRARRCTRWLGVVSVGRDTGPGPSSVRVAGKVRGRRLPKGRYRAVAIAVDEVGNRSRPRWVPLSVVAPRRG